MTARRTITLLVLGLALAGVAGCNRDKNRIAFDGVYFKAKAQKDRDDRQNFVVTVKPVSASLEGARQAGGYEGIRYCVGNFGTSRIKWTVGPETEPGRLTIANDTLTFQGRCDP